MVTQSEIINKNFKQLQEENKVNNAYITGQVSTEKKMFNQLKAMKRSTFDRSKFTATGSPTISENGILTNCSTSDYLSMPAPDFSKPWKIQFQFSTGAIEPTHNICICGISDNSWRGQIAYIQNSDSINAWLYANPTDTSKTIELHSSIKTIKANANVLGYLEWTGTAYNLAISLDGGQNYNIDSLDSTTSLSSLGALRIGHNGYNTYKLDGTTSIDLKQFSIISNGVEVFNGNKTDIDQIKADNYTKVGSPAITEDGIASGFSSANYVKNTNAVIGSEKPFEIQCGFIYTTAFTGDNNALFQLTGSSGWYNYSFIRFSSSASLIRFRLQFNDTTHYDLDISTPFELNKKYIYILGWTGTEYYVKLYQDNTLVGQNNYQSSLPLLNISTATLNIGYDTNSKYFGKEAIDLNSFKIYVDGNLVYQPCLKIPYTLSKTGSKIVNSVYRDRVQDMYKQNGVAQYYTLGENDVTLPMGEIYGMVEDRADVNASNLSSQGKSLISGLGMPSNRYIDLTLGANGSTYTAPDNGWLFFQKVAAAAGQYIQLNNTTAHIIMFSNSSGAYGQAIYVPCKKNDVVTINYTTTGNTLAFRFIYAEGSN